jgi:NAD(P)-dependent dehydrogenase (short-subunit alcohol dehydrogenase family)
MTGKQRTALVTGSSRGIGRGIAVELARQGLSVVVHGSTRSSHLVRAYEEVRQLSPGSICVVADLATSVSIRDLFDTIRGVYDKLDVLVNNAAIQNPGVITELCEAAWDDVMSVNLKAPFLCAQRAASLMKRAGGGKIINISSVHAVAPRRKYAHYSCAKAGLEMLTKCLAMELAGDNIQVNSIMAGAIGTELTPPERQEALLPAVPAHRIGTIEEIARLVAFLSSESCAYMTGTSVTVDGGLTLGFCASRPEL